MTPTFESWEDFMTKVLILSFAFTVAMGSSLAMAAGGCGEGWHRGPNGGCLRNFANPAAHACPRGYHIGPGGRCRGNGR
jgi:hypothetical protein